MLTYKLGNEYRKDISRGLVNKRYDKEVQLDNFLFKYVDSGIYKLDKPVDITRKEAEEFVCKYRNIALLGVYPRGSYIKKSDYQTSLSEDAKYRLYGACSMYYSDAYNARHHSRNLDYNIDLKELLGISERRHYHEPDKDSFEILDIDDFDRNYERKEKDYDVSDYPLAFKFDEAERINGYKTYILFPHYYTFAFLVADGVYKLENSLEVNINSAFSIGDKPVAGILHSVDFHPTMMAGLDYIAVGKENFDTLRDIVENLEYSWFHEFFFESKVIEKEYILDDGITGKTIDEVRREEKLNREEYERNIQGVEIFEGLGFYEIKLDFKSLFQDSVSLDEYKFAYIQGNYLVLNKTFDKSREVKYDLRFIYELTVVRKEILNCGLEEDVAHKIILNCKDKKLKEVLSDEAYSIITQEDK